MTVVAIITILVQPSSVLTPMMTLLAEADLIIIIILGRVYPFTAILNAKIIEEVTSKLVSTFMWISNWSYFNPYKRYAAKKLFHVTLIIVCFRLQTLKKMRKSLSVAFSTFGAANGTIFLCYVSTTCSRSSDPF